LVVVFAFPYIVAIGYPASPTLWVLVIAINCAVLSFVNISFFHSLLFKGFSYKYARDHPWSSLNRPVFSMYSIVSIIFVLSPSSTLIRIPSIPTFLLSLSLSSSYNSRFNRQCSTVSFSAPHSHSAVSMILNRCRYSFKWQCPVRSIPHVSVVASLRII
jgi:hypothetical protein